MNLLLPSDSKIKLKTKSIRIEILDLLLENGYSIGGLDDNIHMKEDIHSLYISNNQEKIISWMPFEDYDDYGDGDFDVDYFFKKEPEEEISEFDFLEHIKNTINPLREENEIDKYLNELDDISREIR